MQTNRIRLFGCAVALAVLLCIPASAQIWVASTGTPVNPLSIATSGPTVALSPSIKTGFTTVRYDVLPIRDLAQPLDPQAPGQCRQMFVRYRDNGSAAQAVVKLMQMDVRSGAITILMTFDSNQQPQAPGLQEGSTLCQHFDFDFADARDNVASHVYWIEAYLIRSGPGGDPALSEIRIVTLNP